MRNYNSNLMDSGQKSRHGDDDPPYQAMTFPLQSELDFGKGGAGHVDVLQGQKFMKRDVRINSMVAGVQPSGALPKAAFGRKASINIVKEMSQPRGSTQNMPYHPN